ncbi:thioredoxin [Calycomorphotria hydatis]|uniref:Thioredoxin n=1 Tax=Calycomorphotria hydatis TaxID=2528027 RepID=A0A517T572_9PLAN|nr:thioredoxin [Calycomorphotria hydatis]QDT63525.1 Thioredoxin [Calycomorphotria hydatis]
MSTSTQSAVLTLEDATFDVQVRQSKQPVLVDVWATWCPPCRILGPTIDALAEDFAGRAVIGKLDADQAPQTVSALGVSALPTVLIFQDGEVVKRLVGVHSKEAYTAVLDQLLD